MEGRRLYTTGEIEEANKVSPMPLTYHAILSTHDKNPLFSSANNCNNLAYLIFETSVLHKYSLFAFCIMPNHIHLLVQPGNVLMNHFINLLRFRYEYVLSRSGYKGAIWQPDFIDYPLPDEEVINTALFIFENPVRNGLVENAAEYPFSFVLGGKKYKP
ncbi:MAG: hypothetical protein COW32_02900 [Candidatus Aquicultor secundus]|uniref:Transposase IS200-like domain-containing protein n=2 Tax=Candidatus Aquicultor secundus TaxID=1973895 RepID=A0A2M7T738_9ACTN|nr:MAG: hypothetical protein COT10_00525 [Candidatus Aquicultor secundus]PIW22719.1 MAG: hypothetical protein COW32_02900 [Candidatus Aquicultor secundus]PIX52029.1 MAG: hypothetical protein COZ51_06340 [Candidatus Aquicultor secundus]PIY42377.1 MAG: hypothetical protein COZ03_00010 [Candidatus Aquicultor secundus]PIZ37511.1 MAG: hypothetical protein COY37_07190 [Candidatus Aquicultor secundus]